ncbi:MAG: cytochrome c3 family protein, partial [Chlorobium sp.]
STSCAECHRTTKWKPATFDHKNLAAAAGKNCITCHKADLPKDNLHRQSQSNCGTCHRTTKWKPATFDHNRYFRLDSDHRVSCKTCHTDASNYKKYTCYNCHEHTEARMAYKHRKEGISNYQNCAKCHRNGEAEGGDD